MIRTTPNTFCMIMIESFTQKKELNKISKHFEIKFSKYNNSGQMMDDESIYF